MKASWETWKLLDNRTRHNLILSLMGFYRLHVNTWTRNIKIFLISTIYLRKVLVTIVHICMSLGHLTSSHLLFYSISHAFNIGVYGILSEILHKHFCSIMVSSQSMALIAIKQTFKNLTEIQLWIKCYQKLVAL